MKLKLTHLNSMFLSFFLLKMTIYNKLVTQNCCRYFSCLLLNMYWSFPLWLTVLLHPVHHVLQRRGCHGHAGEELRGHSVGPEVWHSGSDGHHGLPEDLPHGRQAVHRAGGTGHWRPDSVSLSPGCDDSDCVLILRLGIRIKQGSYARGKPGNVMEF